MLDYALTLANYDNTACLQKLFYNVNIYLVRQNSYSIIIHAKELHGLCMDT